jgi:hypothetical protein
MTIKLLPPDRWNEIPAPVGPDGQIVVIEDDNGKIVGYAVGQPIWHLEPIWIDESLRKTRWPVKLWAGVLAAMQAIGVNLFYTQATTDEHADYLVRLGCTPLPYIPFSGIVPPLKEE